MTDLAIATFDSITSLLRGAELQIEVNAESLLWSVTFHFAEKPNRPDQLVLLSLPPNADSNAYLLAFSRIRTPKLDGGLDEIDATVLRKLIRLSAGAWLARIDLFKFKADNDREIFFARSECSVIGVDGGRLRRRLEAVAELAAKIDEEL